MMECEACGRDPDRHPCPPAESTSLCELEDRSAKEELFLQWAHEKERYELSRAVSQAIADPVAPCQCEKGASDEPHDEPGGPDRPDALPVGFGSWGREGSTRSNPEVDR